MPLYQYLDLEHGRTVELVRPVALRDAVRAGLRRITVPARIGILGTSCTPRDPHTAEAQVPRAYRQLEEQQHGRDWLKESGFSVEQVRQAWSF